MESPKRKRVRPRRVRTAVLGALAACAVLVFGAGSARAAGFSATFDDAALNVSGLTFDILDPPPPATMTGTVTDPGGAVNVPANQFVFPQFSGDALPGVPVTVDFSAVDPIIGTLDLATGSMTTTSSTYHANVQAFGGDCNYDIELSFNTGPGGPFNGDPFTVSTGDPRVITNGILQTNWPANHFPPVGGNCATIDGLVNGSPGGLAMGNGFDLTPAPPPSTAAPPAATTTTTNTAGLKKCKKKAKKIKDPVKRKKALKKCKKKFG
jgi:hypothetical protein